MNRRRKILYITGLLLLTAFLAGSVYFLYENSYLEKILALINTDLSPLLFIVLMVLFPVLGFPISVFLVIAGIKFGIVNAVLLWLAILPVHALLGYTAARYVRPTLKKLFSNILGYEIPTIPAHHEAMFSFLFLAVPGIPYAAKNYLLPLAGVPLRYCVVMNCVVQSLLGLPFIILGKSGAEMNPTLFYIAIAVLVLLLLLLRWLKKRYTVK